MSKITEIELPNGEIYELGGSGGGGDTGSTTNRMPDYTKKIQTILELDTWSSIATGFEWVAPKDCWINGAISTYYKGSSAPTPSSAVAIKIMIENNLVGLNYLSHTSTSMTAPISYFIKKNQTFKIICENSNTQYKAWLYAYDTINDIDPSEDFNQRVTTVENQLDGFRFGVTEDGQYGYYKVGADTVTPFKTGENNLQSNIIFSKTEPADKSKYWIKKDIANKKVLFSDFSNNLKINLSIMQTQTPYVASGFATIVDEERGYIYYFGCDYTDTDTAGRRQNCIRYNPQTDEIELFEGIAPYAGTLPALFQTDNYIYIASGYGSSYSTSTKILTRVLKDTMTRDEDYEITMPVSYAGGYATYYNGLFYLLGGTNTRSVYTFNPETDELVDTGMLLSTINCLGCFVTYENLVYMIGTPSSTSTVTNTIKTFNLDTGVTTTLPITLPKSLRTTKGCLYKDVVIISSGQTASSTGALLSEYYFINLKTNTIYQESITNRPAMRWSNCSLYKNSLYVFGGSKTGNGSTVSGTDRNMYKEEITSLLTDGVYFEVFLDCLDFPHIYNGMQFNIRNVYEVEDHEIIDFYDIYKYDEESQSWLTYDEIYNNEITTLSEGDD